MVVLASRSEAPTGWHHREPTIAEILSDSIVRAVMKADGVDPNVLEAQLRSMALTIPASGFEEADRLAVCRTSPTITPAMFE